MLRNQEAGRWEQFNVTELRGGRWGSWVTETSGAPSPSARSAWGCGYWRCDAIRRFLRAIPRWIKFMDSKRCHEMLPQCDYVAAAAPLTPETKSLIGWAEFAVMKNTAVIINVGRGPVIDEPAMLHALQSGQIRAAALDVFTVEPLPEGHPFYKMDNVLLSPHCSDNTEDWLEQAMLFFYANLERFHKGEALLNVVDKHRGY